MAKDTGPEEILDFSQVRPFEPLDSKVRYRVRVRDLDISRSAASGEKKSHCELTILAPEEVNVETWEPDEDADGGAKFIGLSDKLTRAEGRILFREFSLQPKALPFLYQLLKALDPSVELNEAFRYNPAGYIGMECEVKIKNEAFQEQIRPRVNNIYPAGK
ncbi:hypothetical protein LCGC14_1340310 [marine sediment metagenome]|uniref:Uncharacterized protein n=1 Tax=marine sediment metagenome TaxID=412755 RepID=A0A0F9MUT7_9ZZZZ